MFQHNSHSFSFSMHMHDGLHIGESLKKAVKWYLDHAADNYVWSPKPLDHTK